MHFEVLVEDQSGKRVLEILMPKIIGEIEYRPKIHYYKGIGHIPKNLTTASEVKHQMLLDDLPRRLKGYAKTFVTYPPDCPAAVIVVCDLDGRDKKSFLDELNAILQACDPRPVTRFCLAIEEGEAWFLGDIPAIKSVYPEAKNKILNKYVNDSICGTWEVMADAVYPGGCKSLKKKGGHAIGKEKSLWAEKIAPNMDVDRNLSPSFNHFKAQLTELAQDKAGT
jgi:hypothetical protein